MFIVGSVRWPTRLNLGSCSIKQKRESCHLTTLGRRLITLKYGSRHNRIHTDSVHAGQ